MHVHGCTQDSHEIGLVTTSKSAVMAEVKRPVLTSEPSFKALKVYLEKNETSLNMPEMFLHDPDRFSKYRYGMTRIINTLYYCAKSQSAGHVLPLDAPF